MRKISVVVPGSPASRHNIQPGDILLSINDEPVLDEIDYQALISKRFLELIIRDSNGKERKVKLIKPPEAPLGLQFNDSIIANPKTCANQCVFCFVDQMPKGMRESLYLKDDDWRLSLLMGNYITLTNVSEREFDRIISRKASPLYISVHATDPELRQKILGNKNAHLLMDRLYRLKNAGITFHCQLVLCPGLNDGKHLKQSLDDLFQFCPSALSVAVVPVGLTKYRASLPDIKVYTRDEARKVVGICIDFQNKALNEIGSRFVFPSDEFFSLADLSLPTTEFYENYSQIENGVGMLRRFSEDLEAAHKEYLPFVSNQDKNSSICTLLLPCGEAVYPYLKKWIKAWCPPNLKAKIVPITNNFFGNTVTVTGLITAEDLISQLQGLQGDVVLIVETMLNSENELFLDNKTPQDVENVLQIPVRIFKNNGEAFFHAMITAGNRYLETERTNH